MRPLFGNGDWSRHLGTGPLLRQGRARGERASHRNGDSQHSAEPIGPRVAFHGVSPAAQGDGLSSRRSRAESVLSFLSTEALAPVESVHTTKSAKSAKSRPGVLRLDGALHSVGTTTLVFEKPDDSRKRQGLPGDVAFSQRPVSGVVATGKGELSWRVKPWSAPRDDVGTMAVDGSPGAGGDAGEGSACGRRSYPCEADVGSCGAGRARADERGPDGDRGRSGRDAGGG